MERNTRSRLAKLTLATLAGALVFGGVAAAVAKAESGRSEAATVEALDAATLSLADAIRAVEAAGQGRVTGAEFEVKSGAHYFDVTTESGGVEVDHRIDPMTGAILASAPDIEAPDGDDAADETAERAALDAAKVGLLQAIASAESQGGKALAAEYEHEDGALAIEIEVADATGKVREVTVDAQTGQMLAAELDSDDDEDEDDEDDDAEQEG